MKQISCEITINAPVERIWALLTAFDTYPRWNPFIRKVDGDLANGARLSMTLATRELGEVSIRPRVTRIEPCRMLCWSERLLLPGLLDAEQSFNLEIRGGETVHLVQTKIYRGCLLVLFTRVFENNVRQGMGAMNEALKKWSERTAVGCPKC
jgi:hypothetical protein